LKRPIKAAFNWAAKQNEFATRLSRNPLAGMVVPKFEPRQTFLTDEQWKAVKEAACGSFKDLIEVLEASGARPQELREMTAANLDHDLKCLYSEKQIKETGNTDPRLIPLDDASYAICKRLADQCQTADGLLFRNKRGEPWTKDAIGCQCARLRKTLGFPFSVYLLRHRFCQNELERGTPETELQHLMGHKDGRMISTTYNKWASRKKQLLESFRKRRSA
jgi:integrase